ncbi:MAG: carboxypeptidase regulatory-like domain-containing protein [Planctomycetota bacterium]|nr:MAG: carboxypeptidase regulatory-like domain-containing protein [Planctomycetota bacterium]REJ95463.1 MAG: carboxypeptidase regulatory-like domain-containing protein [Planctomycetota bacterium]REK26541.1 MAG: carboxypeptidase regulatory-like domain-containing protein [Planctomycetota bacterium]REK33994.1 MAG: carboxypeptidase regulatory-like domain-containing protein [Planctomycetota bacterium]
MRIAELVSRTRLTLAIGTVLLLGCGEPAAPVATVSGKVTFDGAPVTNAKVQFDPTSTGMSAVAEVGSDGSYTVTEPIPVGEYAVSVMPSFETPVAGEEGDQDFVPPEAREDIPPKYQNPGESGLTVTLNEGENSYNVEMTAN